MTSAGLALEELLYAGEEAGRMRRGLAVALALEALQELALAGGEVLRRLDLDLDVHVARHLRAQHRHALALETELLAGLGALRHLDPRLAAVDGRHVDVPAERCRRHGDGHSAENVGAVALEELVRLDRQEDIEVAGRPAAHAGLALAGEANARAVLDARRDVDRQRAFAHHAARAAAGAARVVDDLAASLAGGAGALDGEEALAGAHLAGARAGRAGRGLGAGLGAAAGAGLAGDAGGDADLRRLAGERLGQRNLHVVAQVGTALAPGALAAAAPSAHEL